MNTNKTIKTYISLGYNKVRKAIANIDKLSAHSQSRVTHTPFGMVKFCGYRWAWGRISRQYSVSGSEVLHNGGGWTKKGIRAALRAAGM